MSVSQLPHTLPSFSSSTVSVYLSLCLSFSPSLSLHSSPLSLSHSHTHTHTHTQPAVSLYKHQLQGCDNPAMMLRVDKYMRTRTRTRTHNIDIVRVFVCASTVLWELNIVWEKISKCKCVYLCWGKGGCYETAQTMQNRKWKCVQNMQRKEWMLWNHVYETDSVWIVCVNKETNNVCVCVRDWPEVRWSSGETLVTWTGSVRRSPVGCRPSLCGDERNQTAASAKEHKHTHTHTHTTNTNTL